MGLVIARRLNQVVHVGAARITVARIRGDGDNATVSLDIVAPPSVTILRDELVREPSEKGTPASMITVRLSRELHAALANLANDKSDSLNAVCIKALHNYESLHRRQPLIPASDLPAAPPRVLNGKRRP